MNDYNKSFTDIVVSCALFYQQNQHLSENDLLTGSHYKNTAKALRRYYDLLAQIEGEVLSGWVADENNAGWLLRNKPPVFIRVPVHLAALVPTSQYLDDLFEIASRVKTNDYSLICLSGSNSVKNIFDVVDDIDFCEYLPFKNGSEKDDIIRKVKQTNSALCNRVKVNTESHCQPFADQAKLEAAIDEVDPSDANRSTLKIDYIVKMRAKRIYDASNVLIACDEQFHSAGLHYTFAHQEVHISPSDQVPNKLDDVMELGRYICWLLDQIKTYREHANFPKMLKRTLSLTRVAWMRAFSKEIEEFFSNTTYLIEGELAIIAALKCELAKRDLDSEWKYSLEELEILEQVSGLEKKKLALLEERMFPEGTREEWAKGLVDSVISDLRMHSRGALRA